MEDSKAMMMVGKTQMGGGGEQEQQQLKCPRCESTNTKFCYYNNYNLSQPRHFCKACRRYWTVGGALRNIPVGGATRKPHRPSSSSSSKRLPKPAPMPPPPPTTTTTATYKLEDDQCMLPGSYSSLLASNGQLGSLMDSMFSGGSAAPAPPAVQFGDFPAESCNFDGGMEVGDASCWVGVSGWPDLAIYTPGSSFDQ